MLIYLLGIFPLIGPAIIWMVKKDETPALKPVAYELLNFGIGIWIAQVALFILSMVIAAIPIIGVLACLFSILGMVLWVTNLVLCIVGGVKANEGVFYQFPLNYAFLK